MPSTRPSYGRLVGQLFVVLGDLNEAEDVVQEAFTRAAVRWPRVRAYEAPEAWVRRVALNEAFTVLRRAKRQLRLLARLALPQEVPEAPLTWSTCSRRCAAFRPTSGGARTALPRRVLPG